MNWKIKKKYVKLDIKLKLKKIKDDNLVNINLLLFIGLMGFSDRGSVRPIRLDGLILS